jgi:hypothetical protein
MATFQQFIINVTWGPGFVQSEINALTLSLQAIYGTSVMSSVFDAVAASPTKQVGWVN